MLGHSRAAPKRRFRDSPTHVEPGWRESRTQEEDHDSHQARSASGAVDQHPNSAPEDFVCYLGYGVFAMSCFEEEDAYFACAFGF